MLVNTERAKSIFKEYTLYLLIVFFISPLLALPIIVLGLYRQYKISYLFFSLFIGLLAWEQVPLSDLYRHSLNAFNAYGKAFSDVVAGNVAGDNFIPITRWWIVNNNLPYQLFRFFSLSESFFLMTIIFNYMIETSPRIYSNKEVFIRFCILFLFFELVMTTSGVRFGFAVYQYIFALHLVLNRKAYIPAILFACLSAYIHISFAFFIPLSIILFFCSTSLKRISIIFALLFLVMTALIVKFNYLLGRRADWYFQGGTNLSDDTITSITIFGLILCYGVRIFLFPYIIMAIRYFDKYSGWCRITIVWIGLSIVFFTNLTVLNRTLFILSQIGIFMFIDTEARVDLGRRTAKLILWCAIMTTLFNGLNFRQIILNSKYDALLLPLPMIYQDQYSKEWIMDNVDNNRMKK